MKSSGLGDSPGFGIGSFEPLPVEGSSLDGVLLSLEVFGLGGFCSVEFSPGFVSFDFGSGSLSGGMSDLGLSPLEVGSLEPFAS